MTWYQNRLAAFDLETTGIDWNTDRIITAAISLVGGNEDIQSYNWIINPKIEIKKEASDIHGITNKYLEKKGSPAKESIQEIIALLAETLIADIPVIIFNARFDLSILDREAKRYGLKPLQEQVPEKKFTIVDPMVLDRATDRWRPGSRTLAAVCDFYQIKFQENHDANADALAAARLAWRISTKYSIDVPLLELHQRQVAWAEKQAKELKGHYQQTGKEIKVDSSWPIVFD